MILIISFLLDGIISNMYNNSYFIPLFSLMSLLLILNKNDNYYGYAILLGLLYDISYTDTLFLNCLIFLLITYLIKKIEYYLSYNIFNQILISILIILIYRILTYFILTIIGYLSFDLLNLGITIIKSLPLNIFYVCLIYYLRYLKKHIFKVR